ncbi:tryptophan--tRNA ligase, partial [bacterium]|nr:tryptophan--tRNA ligase [candidate division CSSED10-310 bacterium]
MEYEKRVMSGIQPTGDIHIGNYLGAIRQWIELTRDHKCFYVIVDYHAITIEYDVAAFRGNVFRAALVNAACGLMPGTCLMFAQSQVPEHTELCWVLNSCTMVGRLTNMTQFKDKSQQHSDNINAGLLVYPVLQAADILVYKAAMVPVGEDQLQHLELTREVAKRFNQRFGETFPMASACGKSVRIMGLDGESKMSKSKGNYIGILDPPDVVWEKLRPAKTDIKRMRRTDPGNPLVCNIYSLHEHFTPEDKREELAHGCRNAGIGCIQCKKVLAGTISATLAPIQDRYQDLSAHPDLIRD